MALGERPPAEAVVVGEGGGLEVVEGLPRGDLAAEVVVAEVEVADVGCQFQRLGDGACQTVV